MSGLWLPQPALTIENHILSPQRRDLHMEITPCTNMALGTPSEGFLGQGVIKDQVHNFIPMTDSSGLVITPLGLERAVCPHSPIAPQSSLHPFSAPQALCGSDPFPGDAMGLLARWAPLAGSAQEAALHCPPSHHGPAALQQLTSRVQAPVCQLAFRCHCLHPTNHVLDGQQRWLLLMHWFRQCWLRGHWLSLLLWVRLGLHCWL